MKITRFEDIEAWKAARRLMNTIYELTRLKEFEEDPDLRRQMRRAAASSMSNIAEGFDAGYDGEFSRFLRISRRSATEQQSHLYVALDQGYVGQEVFDTAYAQAQEVKRLIHGFIRYLKSSSGHANMVVRDVVGDPTVDLEPDTQANDQSDEEEM